MWKRDKNVWETLPDDEKNTYIQQGYKYVCGKYERADNFFSLSLNEVTYLKKNRTAKGKWNLPARM